MKNFATHAQQHFGATVLIAGVAHTISSLAEKTGKLKNGQDAPYLIVTAADGKTDMLHPRTVVTLFSKGEAAGIKMLVDAIATEASPVTNATPAKAKKAKLATAKDTSTKAKPIMIRIFNETIAAKGSRQDVIQGFMEESGCSKHCANTYYQNMRSGKPGWQ